jgi:hypothetical protein
VKNLTTAIVAVLCLVVAGPAFGARLRTPTPAFDRLPYDSLNCRLLGNWPFGPWGAVTCDTERMLSFYANGGGVCIFDIANDSLPVKLSDGIRCASQINNLCLQDRRLYLLLAGIGLEIWDVSSPSGPWRVGGCALPDSACAIQVVPPYAYVANWDSGLRVLDVSDPANPHEVASCLTPKLALGVSVLGQYAYVADAAALRIIDVLDPLNPSEVGRCSLPGGYAREAGVQNGYTFVADGDMGLRVIDVSPPESAHVVASCATTYAWGVAVSGQYAYCAAGGLAVVDISNPASPHIEGTCPTLSLAEDVAVAGHCAGVVDVNYPAGLCLIDVSNPAAPARTGSYPAPYLAACPCITGQYAFVAWDYDGLRVLDVSNPAGVTEVGSCPTPEYSDAVYVAGQYAYVACDESGLRVLDVSDPTNPHQVGYYNTPGTAWDVHVRDTLAFVADEERGVRIINVADPTRPRELGYQLMPDDAEAVYARDTFMYVANAGWGLRVFSVANPTSPRQIGFFYTTLYLSALDVAGNHAYLAAYDYDSGLVIVDISNPASPVEVGRCSLPGYAEDVSVAGNHAYVACYGGGLRIVNVADPAHPFEDGYHTAPAGCYGVFAVGNRAYVAAGQLGLWVFEGPVGVAEAHPGAELNALRVAPSPARDFVWVSGLDGNGRLRLYDITGKLVRELTPEDGRVCVSGIPAGVYVAGLESAGKRVFSRLVVTR